jgi:kynurenine formamidase
MSDKRFPFKIIDLSHPISSEMPLWPGDPKTSCEDRASIEKDGYNLKEWKIGEHSGTHVGAPAHFDTTLKTIDMFSAEELVFPLHVIHTKNYKELSQDDIFRHEEQFGLIKEGSIVVLHSGWDNFWPDQVKVYKSDDNGNLIFPGFNIDAADWLIQNRQIGGLGTDTPGVDSGWEEEFKVGKQLASSGLIHLENLANLSEMPESGGWILVGALPLKGGFGSPARVFGLVDEVTHND